MNGLGSAAASARIVRGARTVDGGGRRVSSKELGARKLLIDASCYIIHEHVSEFAAQIVVPMTWRGGGESTVGIPILITTYHLHMSHVS